MKTAIAVPYFAFRDFPEGIEQEVKAALLNTVESKQYILGKQVSAFETAFAKASGTTHAIGVGSGLDALTIALRAAGISTGDEVIVPANTFIATANAVMLSGATPVFADPDENTYNLTATSITGRITSKTKAIIPVHLYGQVCEMEAIMALADNTGLKVIEDAAQAHGATYKGRYTGTFGLAGAFSFYPTKNLGAIGDAGAVLTNDVTAADFVRTYRNYGELQKYQNELIGVNSRLDALQAAVLQVKLKYLPKFNAERQRLAAIYMAELKDIGDLTLPFTAPDCSHVYHIYNVRTNKRDKLQAYLHEKGILTAIHYPVPVHLQPAYKFLDYKSGSFPIAEKLAATSLSLPLFPGLKEAEQAAVISAVKSFFS
jgi:dTDP-4-amino-4,6-dideoxygalactose transaminase